MQKLHKKDYIVIYVYSKRKSSVGELKNLPYHSKGTHTLMGIVGAQELSEPASVLPPSQFNKT